MLDDVSYLKTLFIRYTSMTYSHGNNIAGLFDALPNFPFTTSKTKRNYK